MAMGSITSGSKVALAVTIGFGMLIGFALLGVGKMVWGLVKPKPAA